MLDADKMRRSLRVLKEMNQANKRPLLILQNNLPQSQQHSLGLLYRPVVLKEVHNKNVFELIFILCNYLDTIFCDKTSVDSIEHHNSTMIDFTILAVNFFAQESVIKPM